METAGTPKLIIMFRIIVISGYFSKRLFTKTPYYELETDLSALALRPFHGLCDRVLDPHQQGTDFLAHHFYYLCLYHRPELQGQIFPVRTLREFGK